MLSFKRDVLQKYLGEIEAFEAHESPKAERDDQVPKHLAATCSFS